MEETGIRVQTIGPEIGRRLFTLQMPDGEHVEADERFFLVKSADASLSCAGWTALEQEVMTEHKWWSREELALTSATVWPENLLTMLDAAAAPSSQAMRLSAGTYDILPLALQRWP